MRKSKSKSSGQSMAEYALVLALITVVCIAGITMLGDGIKGGLLGLASTIFSTKTTP